MVCLFFEGNKVSKAFGVDLCICHTLAVVSRHKRAADSIGSDACHSHPKVAPRLQ